MKKGCNVWCRKLNSNAFQVYMLLGLDDRKDYDKLVTELCSRFKKRTLDWETALAELADQLSTNPPTSEQVNYAGSINSWIRLNNFREKNYYREKAIQGVETMQLYPNVGAVKVLTILSNRVR